MSNRGGARGGQRTGYTPRSEEQKLNKKLEAANKNALTLKSSYVSNMEVWVDKQYYGEKDTVVMKMGMMGNYADQFCITRPIGFTSLESNEWVAMPASQIAAFHKKRNNPFEEKCGKAVNALKMAAAVEAGLLEEKDGIYMYPGGVNRQQALDEAGELFATHKKVEGAKTLTPSLLYMSSANATHELALLKGWATDAKLQQEIAKVVEPYRSYETTGGAGTLPQRSVDYLKGVPASMVQVAIQSRLTGMPLPVGWENLLEKAAVKRDRFTPTAYEGVPFVEAASLQMLTSALKEFLEASKDYHKKLAKVATKEQKANENETDKNARIAAHQAMQAAAHTVKEKEITKYTGITQKAYPVPDVSAQAVATTASKK